MSHSHTAHTSVWLRRPDIHLRGSRKTLWKIFLLFYLLCSTSVHGLVTGPCMGEQVINNVLHTNYSGPKPDWISHENKKMQPHKQNPTTTSSGPQPPLGPQRPPDRSGRDVTAVMHYSDRLLHSCRGCRRFAQSSISYLRIDAWTPGKEVKYHTYTFSSLCVWIVMLKFSSSVCSSTARHYQNNTTWIFLNASSGNPVCFCFVHTHMHTLPCLRPLMRVPDCSPWIDMDGTHWGLWEQRLCSSAPVTASHSLLVFLLFSNFGWKNENRTFPFLTASTTWRKHSVRSYEIESLNVVYFFDMNQI